MRKLSIILILFVLIVADASAQQTAQYKYQIFDDYALNPAYVGSMDYYPVIIGQDQRFYGLTGSSPQTYFLSIHSRVGEGFLFEKDGKINKFFEKFGNIALGLQMYQYVLGPSLETNIGVTYGYHLNLNQNYKRKNPRKMVLAVTPRFKRMGFNANEFILREDGLLGGEGNFYDPSLGELDKVRSWTFTTDVGALYQTVHGDFGVGALDFIKTKNKLESDLLTINDSTSISTYDSLYPTKLIANVKLTFIEMYNGPKLDVSFVPSVAALYSTKINRPEFYIDLMLESRFKEHIAGVRSKVQFIGQLGLNIYHTRVYNPATFLQPYVTFDFANYTIQYAHTINIDSDLVAEPGISGGGQISVLFKIANDRVERTKRQVVSWHD